MCIYTYIYIYLYIYIYIYTLHAQTKNLNFMTFRNQQKPANFLKLKKINNFFFYFHSASYS